MTVPSETLKKPCPICRRAAADRFRPFCSARCADVDLGRWFSESYRVPVANADAAEPDDADSIRE